MVGVTLIRLAKLMWRRRFPVYVISFCGKCRSMQVHRRHGIMRTCMGCRLQRG